MSDKIKSELPEKDCRENPKEEPPIYINIIEMRRLLALCGYAPIPLK